MLENCVKCKKKKKILNLEVFRCIRNRFGKAQKAFVVAAFVYLFVCLFVFGFEHSYLNSSGLLEDIL